MKSLKIYHNPKCSKSREALNLLTEQGFCPDVIEYLQNPLNESELLQLLMWLPGEPAELVRTKEVDFQESPFDLNSAPEVARQLALRPHLMERPVVAYKNKAAIGRPLENIVKILETAQDE